MTKQQQRTICEAKRARARAVLRGDIHRVQALNAIIASARR